MARGKLRQAVDESIAAAVAAKAVDAKAQAAPIEALRLMADRVDADPESKDNVTFPTMLKYMDALGILPDASAKQAAKTVDVLTAFTAKHRYSKGA